MDQWEEASQNTQDDSEKIQINKEEIIPDSNDRREIHRHRPTPNASPDDTEHFMMQYKEDYRVQATNSQT